MPTSARDVPARLWKPTSTRVRARACVLLDDVREHAVAGRQLEAPHDLLEQLLEPDDRVEVVGRRVEPDDDVAAAVREPFEDREQDLLLVVAGAVRLDARPEVPPARRWRRRRRRAD